MAENVIIANSGQELGITPVSEAQLSAAIQSVPRIYGALTSLFTRRAPLGGILASFDLKVNPLTLVGWSAFGDRGDPIERGILNNKTLQIVHSNTPDRITQMDVWNRRAWGTVAQMTVEQLTNEKLINAINAHKTSMEKAAFSVLYEGRFIDPKSGLVLYDYSDVFKVTDIAGTTHGYEVTEKTWSFADAQYIPTYLTTITDELDQKNAQQWGWDGTFSIFTRRAEFDGFMKNAFIKEQLNYLQMGAGIKSGLAAKDTYQGAQRADEIDQVYFRNAVIKRYRGQFAGSEWLPASHMLIVPNGIQTLIADFGPCDRFFGGGVTANAGSGQDHYVLQWMNPDGSGINMDTQTNYLLSNLRPDLCYNIEVTNNPVS